MKICLPLVFIILIVMFPGSAFSETNNPITIGYSNRHDATNANNGRRVVRSVEGDLFVVYMDSLNGSSVIWGTMSTNGGEDWSKPALIDTGDYCSCAIAQDSSIDKTYLCYTASGGQEIRVKYPFSDIGPELPFQEIRRGGATTCQYPAIEATSRWVHVVWQETNLYTQTSNIYYQRFSLDLHLKSHIAVLSSDSCNSRLPVIAADLEYQPGLVHIMWTDYPISGAHSRITYMNITEKDEIKRCAPQVLPESHGCEHPSISTRNNYYGPYEIASYLVVAHSDPVNKRVCFAWVYADTSGIRTSTNDHLNTATAPVVSVDDILPSEPSCAIVWQDDRDIYYSQTLGTRLIVYPPVMISEPNYVYKG